MLTPSADALTACLMEIERHTSHLGWDQPARLFALVRTADLLAAEPSLVGQLGDFDRAPDHLSSVEQDDFATGEDLETELSRIAWPPAVLGCALAVERVFLPSGFEDAIPQQPDAAARFVATHPNREDVRIVAGVLRGGSRYCLARVASRPDDLLAADDLVPGLLSALAATLD